MGVSTKSNHARTIKQKYALKMETKDNIFGCFFKVGVDSNLSEQEATKLASVFRTYLWGENGFGNILKKLKYMDYGKDVTIVLFKFYINPTTSELNNMKEIEPYRKREKSIAIPIVVTNDNFFNKTEEEKYYFMRQSIFQKLEFLERVIQEKKLDTKTDLLRIDLHKLLI